MGIFYFVLNRAEQKIYKRPNSTIDWGRVEQAQRFHQMTILLCVNKLNEI